jgi:hypothetical protein
MVATKTGVSWRLQTSLLQAALVASISMSALRLIAQWPSDIHFDGSSNVWAINKQQSVLFAFLHSGQMGYPFPRVLFAWARSEDKLSCVFNRWCADEGFAYCRKWKLFGCRTALMWICGATFKQRRSGSIALQTPIQLTDAPVESSLQRPLSCSDGFLRYSHQSELNGLCA